MRPFIAAILLAASSAHADAIYKGPSGYVRLSNISCSSVSIISAIKPNTTTASAKAGW
jgi:hypothetical protein